MPTAKTPDSAAIVLVSLRWNGEPLAARAVNAGDSVIVGDAKGALAHLPPDVLGGATLVIADNEGGPHLHVPEGKVASIVDRGGRVRLVAGPERAALSPGEEASVLFGAFEMTMGVEKAEPAPRRRRISAGAWIHTAVVAAVHAALLVAGSRAALASSIIEEDATTDLDALRGYLAAAEERSSAADAVRTDGGGQTDTARTNGRNGNGKDAGGERRSGTAGKAGDADSRAKNRHFGAPPAPEKVAAPTAESELRDARDFGIAGILNTMNAGPAWRTEGTSPWGASDLIAASGGLLGRITGESEGASGLALSGTGEGGGGRGDGIGLGTIGTIGHADGLAGLGTGGTGTSLSGIGFGSGRGRYGRERSKVTVLRWGHGSWYSGRLPPEAIRRVIRTNFGRFRACYLHGLMRNPALAGRVTTKFVIGRDGSVASVGDAGTDLPDLAVSACVRRAFYGLSFPQPEDGIVSVVYPIVFSNE